MAYWLVEKGARYVRDKYPATDPKYHGETRSELNIIHDLHRTDTRTAIYEMCEKQDFQIGWKKTDLFHKVKPDDLFEITKTKTARFFLEQEVHKKSFEEMHDKLESYIRLRDSEEFKTRWGFKFFTVLIPMRDINSMQNLIIHLRGACNCLDRRFKEMHKNAPFLLESQHLWFTTSESMVNNASGKIFFNTFDGSPHSLLDIVQ